MPEKPFSNHSAIVLPLAILFLLSGCNSVFSNGLDEKSQLQLDTMDSTIIVQQQHISELEDEVNDLNAKNEHLGLEVHSLRERMALLFEEVEIAKTSAEEAVQNAVLSRGDVAIHLASYRTMENTIAGWQTYSEKYGDGFDGLVGIVSVFTSGTGDEFFRLKAGPFASQGSALEFCKILEARDDYCNVDKFEGDILD